MNPIPGFQVLDGHDYDVLPDGVYSTDEATFYDRFVGQMPESTTREDICRGFMQLRGESRERGILARQWVDGSFVESKPDPEDVDVVTFCDYDELNALRDEDQRFVEERLAAGEATKMPYRTHTFLVPSCNSEHEYYGVFEHYRRYWRTWFGTTRTGQRKGIIEMAIGNPNHAPRIGHTRD